jgi:hypothetical protein
MFKGVEERQSSRNLEQASRSSWLPYLSTVALALLASLLYLLPQDPLVSARIEQLKAPLYRAQQARQLAALMRNDPRPGAAVVTNQNRELWKTLQKSTRGAPPAILLFIGPCSSCVEKDLFEWRDVMAKRAQRSLIVVSRDTPEGIARFVRSTGYPLPIVPDPHGEIANHINAFWAPRAYAVAADGRLTWLQKTHGLAPEAVAQEVWRLQRS